MSLYIEAEPQEGVLIRGNDADLRQLTEAIEYAREHGAYHAAGLNTDGVHPFNIYLDRPGAA